MVRRLVAWLTGWLLCCNAAAAILEFRPATSNASDASPVSIGIWLSGADLDESGLGAFDLTVVFASDVIEFVEALGAGALGLNSTGLQVLESEGSVQLLDISFESTADLIAFQGEELQLASLHFLGVGNGTSVLQFDNVLLSTAQGSELSAEPLSGSVIVSPIPEPSSRVLTTVAVLLLVLLPFRRCRSGQYR